MNSSTTTSIQLAPAPPSVTESVATYTRKSIATATQAVARLESVDLYRGLIMVIMLLDHTRDFVHRDGMYGDPLSLATTTPLLYFTRWITHLCAPGFALLAGASAGFQRQRGATIPTLSRFLWTRGLVLVLIELTLVRVLAQGSLHLNFIGNLQVIWAIGVSMIALAALVHLPQRAILAIGLTIVLGHNLLDTITVPVWTGPAAVAPTAWAKLWMVLHQGGFFPIGGSSTSIVKVNYPVLPWIGVVAMGYMFANLWTLEAERRRKTLRWLAVAMVAAFVALRFGNVYGDNLPWHTQDTLLKSIGSFFNVQKYPPSLLYLLATLAPCLFALSVLDGRKLTAFPSRALLTYGRVPMFYYLLQWAWAKLSGLVVTYAAGLSLAPYFRSRADVFLGAPLPVFGGTLLHVYVCWLLGVVVLYFPCRWYAGVKARRKDLVWLRYL